LRGENDAKSWNDTLYVVIIGSADRKAVGTDSIWEMSDEGAKA